MTGRWVLVDGGRHLCEVCGNFIGKAWLFYATPTLHTHCVCETCAEKEQS